jgi:hypothetical protein
LLQPQPKSGTTVGRPRDTYASMAGQLRPGN